MFREKLNQHLDHFIVYTDGSVINELTGCAITSKTFDQEYRLTDNTSIFSAELYAIQKAVETVNNTTNNKILICSDSLSALQSIQQLYSNLPIVQKIHDLINNSSKTFKLLWIPSHAGITGNEKADALAKNATSIPINDEYQFVGKDMKQQIKQETFKKWKEYWDLIPEQNNKMKKIIKTIPKWTNLHEIPRIESIKMTRLRIGHSLATHKYILDITTQPKCICKENLTIDHIFNRCRKYYNTRIKYGIQSLNILAEDTGINTIKIMNFLKETNLYHKI